MEISIIIPVYNKIKYLETVLDQVRNQTMVDFECIIIDDGSIDGSSAVCDAFAVRDSRFKVFHIPNGGVSRARNMGLEKASGAYITFIDADDQIHPEYLQNLYQCVVESGASMVIGNLQKYWQDREDTVVLPIPYQGLYSMEELLPEFAQIQQTTGIYGFCVSKLVRRELFRGISFDPQIKLAEDLNLYLDIYPKLDAVYFDQKPYYRYLQAAENSSMLDDDAKIDYFTQLKIQLKIADYLEQKGAFFGDNRRIMINRLYDYVYFCLFYGKRGDLKHICAKIRALGLPRNVDSTGENSFKKMVLFCYECKWDWAIVALIGCYRAVRMAIRSIK